MEEYDAMFDSMRRGRSTPSPRRSSPRSSSPSPRHTPTYSSRNKRTRSRNPSPPLPLTPPAVVPMSSPAGGGGGGIKKLIKLNTRRKLKQSRKPIKTKFSKIMKTKKNKHHNRYRR